MGDSILELKDLSHSYDGSEISLKNISLIVNKAEKVFNKNEDDLIKNEVVTFGLKIIPKNK